MSYDRPAMIINNTILVLTYVIYAVLSLNFYLFNNKYFNYLGYVLIFFVSVFVQGEYRNDYDAYLRIFEGYIDLEIEPLFLILNQFLIFFIPEPRLLFGIYGVITLYGFKKFVEKFVFSPYRPYSIFLFLILPIFFWGSLNLLRQYFSIAIGLLGIVSYSQSKFFLSFLYFGLSIAMHSSSIIYPLFALALDFSIIFHFLLLFLFFNIIILMCGYFDMLIPEKYQYFFSRESQNSKVKSIIFVIISLPIFLIYIKKKYRNIVIILMYLWLIFSLFGFILSNNMSSFFIRLGIMGFPGLLVIFPEVKRYKYPYFFSIFILLGIFIYYFLISQ